MHQFLARKGDDRRCGLVRLLFQREGRHHDRGVGGAACLIGGGVGRQDRHGRGRDAGKKMNFHDRPFFALEVGGLIRDDITYLKRFS